MDKTSPLILSFDMSILNGQIKEAWRKQYGGDIRVYICNGLKCSCVAVFPK